MEGSLDYAMTAVAAGTMRIVATPHVERVDVHELPDRVHELRAALRRENIPLAVECGGELKSRSGFSLSQEELEVIAQGPPGRRWLLYEVPFRGVDELFLEGARELRERGFGLVCAHPERSQGLLSGGLAAPAGAACVARPGLGVLVLERGDVVGAACVPEEWWPGVRASPGASPRSLLRRTIIDELGARRQGLRVAVHEPYLFAPLPDG